MTSHYMSLGTGSGNRVSKERMVTEVRRWARRTFCHNSMVLERYLCVEKAKIKPKNNTKAKL